jgi:hypothetical protein
MDIMPTDSRQSGAHTIVRHCVCRVCCSESGSARLIEAGYVVDRVACCECGAERLEPHSPVEDFDIH